MAMVTDDHHRVSGKCDMVTDDHHRDSGKCDRTESKSFQEMELTEGGDNGPQTPLEMWRLVSH